MICHVYNAANKEAQDLFIGAAPDAVVM
jgi:hypothetical protein